MLQHRKSTLGVLGAVGLWLLTATPVAGQATIAAEDSSAGQEALLMPGDAVRLAFWREPALDGDYPVDERGIASLPLLGPINVVNVEPSSLKEQLMARYARELRDNEVQITFLRRIRILGAVNQPGLYHVDPTMTIADAVALAGGVTQNGTLTHIDVHRSGARLQADLSPGMIVVGHLQSGDQITVSERSWFARNAAVLLGTTISATAIIVSRLIN